MQVDSQIKKNIVIKNESEKLVNILGLMEC